jgi:hypothetical protein
MKEESPTKDTLVAVDSAKNVSLEMVVSTVLRSRLVMVRRASGTAAPEESVTVPAMPP